MGEFRMIVGSVVNKDRSVPEAKSRGLDPTPAKGKSLPADGTFVPQLSVTVHGSRSWCHLQGTDFTVTFDHTQTLPS
jgi:hypothetical protein